jgi:hypothetical protein
MRQRTKMWEVQAWWKVYAYAYYTKTHLTDPRVWSRRCSFDSGASLARGLK